MIRNDDSQNVNLDNIENYTTRPMREGESDGNPYYFLSREEFFKLKEEGFFAELIEYNGEHYEDTIGGTSFLREFLYDSWRRYSGCDWTKLYCW